MHPLTRIHTHSRSLQVDFFWVNSGQESFEWFLDLMAVIEEDEKEYEAFKDFITLNMYMTAAKSRGDIRGIGLQLALDLLHRKKGVDAITGLRSRTKAGRPDFEPYFQDLAKSKHGRVTVFFCGPVPFAQAIKKLCYKYGE